MDPDLQHRVKSRMAVEDRGYETPCWISDRASHPKGYTKIGINGHTKLTHRVAYEAFVGPIPEGMQIDHLCKQTACCNPKHLEPVTARENLIRGDTVTAREVATTHCPRGHEYTLENTYQRPDGLRKRDCNICRSERSRRAHARKRELGARSAHGG